MELTCNHHSALTVLTLNVGSCLNVMSMYSRKVKRQLLEYLSHCLWLCCSVQLILSFKLFWLFCAMKYLHCTHCIKNLHCHRLLFCTSVEYWQKAAVYHELEPIKKIAVILHLLIFAKSVVLFTMKANGMHACMHACSIRKQCFFIWTRLVEQVYVYLASFHRCFVLVLM